MVIYRAGYYLRCRVSTEIIGWRGQDTTGLLVSRVTVLVLDGEVLPAASVAARQSY